MKQFLAACRRVVGVALRRSLAWLSIPVNFCLAALALVFLVSLLSWAIGDHYAESVLFFPDGRSGALRGEMRDLPRVRGAEARAELVASEVLLGPRNPALVPAFPPDVRVQSTMYRGRMLFVDISEAAALEETTALKRGLAALRRSLSSTLPGLQRIVLTIGGREPYVDGIQGDPGNEAKKKKNN